jgi:predicted nucleotidyltransferase
MNPSLEAAQKKLEQHFRADRRCVGIYLWGSAARGTADAHSDLDLALVVRDNEFAAVKSELRATCERLCGKIQGWLPEGERDQSVNFAFLFEAEDRLLLCDLTLITAAFLAANPRAQPIRILYDPDGLLAAAVSKAQPRPFSPDHLLRMIHEYWVYAYLNGKYWQRSDLHKLLYVQQALFQIHMRLLRAFHPDTDWTWWPISMHHLAPDHQERLRVYFGANDLAAIPASLKQEFDLFSRDAQEAARLWNVVYPQALECSVRWHLQEIGIPLMGRSQEESDTNLPNRSVTEWRGG